MFSASQAQKNTFFRSGQEKVPFFCVFQASQAQKKYLVFVPNNRKKVPFSKPLKPKKGTFFVPDGKKEPFSVFSKPLKPKKGTFSFRTGKTYLFFGLFQASQKGTFFGVFQASQAQKKVLFCVPDRFWVFFKPLKPKKRYLFRSGPEKCTFYRTACEPNRSTGSNRFTRT